MRYNFIYLILYDHKRTYRGGLYLQGVFFQSIFYMHNVKTKKKTISLLKFSLMLVNVSLIKYK